MEVIVQPLPPGIVTPLTITLEPLIVAGCSEIVGLLQFCGEEPMVTVVEAEAVCPSDC